MSFSTVSMSWVIAWKPPTAPVSSKPYIDLSSCSYRLAPPPLTYGVSALSISGTTLTRLVSAGRIFSAMKSSTSAA